MKVAFVTMRYGDDVVGGAEAFCKIFAEHLSGTWDIDVITTDSNDYYAWKKSSYPKGNSELHGVNVIRFAVDEDLDAIGIGDLTEKYNKRALTHEEQIKWINTHGPMSSEMFSYIEDHKDDYDVFFFWGYLWAHTYYGMQPVAHKAVIVPFIHDEKPFYFDVYKKMFESASGFLFQTPEEMNLLRKTVPKATKNYEIAGIYVDHPENPEAIKLPKKLSIDDPYIVYVGRIEPAKGVYNLVDMFRSYKKNNPSKLKLVLVGKSHNDFPEEDDIVFTGPVFGDEKFAIIHRARVLINPSEFESFSLVLAEAWHAGVPVLVNEKCAVLKGQCTRSNGGLWYSNPKEFNGMLSVLLENEELPTSLAENGKQYLKENYSWDVIDSKYQQVADRVIATKRKSSKK